MLQSGIIIWILMEYFIILVVEITTMLSLVIHMYQISPERNELYENRNVLNMCHPVRSYIDRLRYFLPPTTFQSEEYGRQPRDPQNEADLKFNFEILT